MLLRLLVVSLVACACRTSAAAEVQVCRDGKALLPVVVGEQATDATRKVAAELAAYLSRIGGATFAVETGEAKHGIVVGRATDFSDLPTVAAFGDGPFDREDYLLRSGDGVVWVIGASELGVSHAVWDLLYQLGHRHYFPGDAWEIIPRQTDLRIAVDRREKPDFHARRIWYNWGTTAYNRDKYEAWCRHNRMARGFELNSGHAYGRIYAARRAQFDANPSFLAEVDGVRTYRGGDTKFCLANAELRQLVVDYAVAEMQRQPGRDSISMDPSDGDNWCECADCAAMGGISNRVVTVANEVAAAINDLGIGDKYVGMYAYNRHCLPPTIPVHANVVPSITTAFLTQGLTFDTALDGWQQKAATVGVYDYLSVIAWDWNLPRQGKAAKVASTAQFLASLHARNVKFYDAESGECWGPCGLGYYVASRVLWDVTAADEAAAIIDEFCRLSFGDADEPMREVYRLLNEDQSRRSINDVLARLYRHLARAWDASSDEQVRTRLSHLILYARYVELYDRHASGGDKQALLKHLWRMRHTGMVHTLGALSRLVGNKAAHAKGQTWQDETVFTEVEIRRMLAAGVAAHTPENPGFEAVAFGDNLVPAVPALKLRQGLKGTFPPAAQGHQQYYLWIDEPGAFELKVQTEKVWAKRMPELRLYSPSDVTVTAVATAKDLLPDNQLRAVRLATPYGGLHRLEVIDGGDYTRLQWPEAAPVTLASGIETKRIKEHFRGKWTLYFYVPKGTREIGGWADRIANWAPPVSGYLRDADGELRYDFRERGSGWFLVEVPPGQDGRLWCFDQSDGIRRLMTVPPYLARSADELLLPQEVILRDK